MQRRFLTVFIISFSFISVINWGCSKLDVTDIGGDLLPAVDNVNTFDTVLTINTTQGIFTDTPTITRQEDHVLGKISNDPLFGTTTANVFMQLKPTFYPFFFGTNTKDTINNSIAPGTRFDSVVLCLSYRGFWGDSTQPVNLQVKEIALNNGKWDSLYENKNTLFVPNTGAILGTANIDVRTLSNWVKYRNKKDSVRYQIRIKLDPSSAFVNRILNNYNNDTTVNGMYYKDSLFRSVHNGIAVFATGGQGLITTNLADTNTKIEVHYIKKNGGSALNLDTTYTSFKLSTNFLSVINFPSSTSNNVVRNRGGSEIASPAADFIYLQTGPGSYANLSIPGLSGLSNRIVHRAELIVEQVPSINDNILTPPDYLYLDLKDTGSTNKWKPLYFDLNPTITYDPDFKLSPTYYPGVVDLVYFGGFVRNKVVLGIPIKFYNINITRYVQQIVTDHTTNYQMRLFAPYTFSYPQYASDVIPYYNPFAVGRVKVGSGSNANYKMRLRIIYSKI